MATLAATPAPNVPTAVDERSTMAPNPTQQIAEDRRSSKKSCACRWGCPKPVRSTVVARAAAAPAWERDGSRNGLDTTLPTACADIGSATVRPFGVTTLEARLSWGIGCASCAML